MTRAKKHGKARPGYPCTILLGYLPEDPVAHPTARPMVLQAMTMTLRDTTTAAEVRAFVFMRMPTVDMEQIKLEFKGTELEPDEASVWDLGLSKDQENQEIMCFIQPKE